MQKNLKSNERIPINIKRLTDRQTATQKNRQTHTPTYLISQDRHALHGSNKNNNIK